MPLGPFSLAQAIEIARPRDHVQGEAPAWSLFFVSRISRAVAFVC